MINENNINTFFINKKWVQENNFQSFACFPLISRGKVERIFDDYLILYLLLRRQSLVQNSLTMKEANQSIKKQRITYTIATEAIEIAEQALVRLGYDSKSNFAKSISMSFSTVTQFFGGKPIQLDSWQKICQELKLSDWQEIAIIEKERLNLVKIDYCSNPNFQEESEDDVAKTAETFNKWQIVEEIVNHPTANRSLSNIDLSDTDLSDTDLSRADLSNANLSDADLSHADLRGADLRGADLNNANLRSAYLNGANLRGADLRDADLSNANLSNADLSNTCLNGSNFKGVDLVCANLSNANLSNADLQGAYLRGANLSNANLSNANLNGPFKQELMTT